MKKSLLEFYGKPVLGFGDMVAAKKRIEEIDSGEFVQEVHSRLYCYEVRGVSRVVRAIEMQMGLGGQVSEIEIFYPQEDYPPHVDGTGETVAVALREKCGIEIDGNYVELGMFDTIMFDDRLLHKTTGPFLMMTLKD